MPTLATDSSVASKYVVCMIAGVISCSFTDEIICVLK
jgi:hypothetical protein